MKPLLLLLVWILSLILVLHWADGLDCYVCNHIEGFPEEYAEKWGLKDFDKSCKNGKVPNKKYSQTCDDDKGRKNVTCGKIYATGRVDLSGGDHVEFKGTSRGCLQTVNQVPEKCIHDLSPEEVAKEPDVPAIIINVTDLFPSSTKISACVCKSDKCNSSSIVEVNYVLSILSIVAAVVHKLLAFV